MVKAAAGDSVRAIGVSRSAEGRTRVWLKSRHVRVAREASCRSSHLARTREISLGRLKPRLPLREASRTAARPRLPWRCAEFRPIYATRAKIPADRTMPAVAASRALRG